MIAFRWSDDISSDVLVVDDSRINHFALRIGDGSSPHSSRALISGDSSLFEDIDYGTLEFAE